MITANGLVIKRLAQIIEEYNAAARATFGESIDVSPTNPLGQFIGIAGERESELWKLAQDVYNNQYPHTATERSLDLAVTLTGTRRKPATRSTIARGIARGADGTVVPAGTIIAVAGDPDAQFATENEATIDIADGANFISGDIALRAVYTGPVIARMGTLNVIVNPVSGMESFTNLDNAQVGSRLETDAELKARRTQELNLAGSSTIEAIRSDLSARANVTNVQVFQNASPLVINDRPPHSIEIVVQGDDDDDLAQTIFDLVAGGIATTGDITKTITDSQGFEQIIKFSRPTPVDIFVDFALDTTSDYPADGEALIKAAVLAYGRNLSIGENIVLIGSEPLIQVLDEIPGIVGATVRIGKSAATLMAENIQLNPDEIAVFVSDNITVTAS